jgi:subtilisin family serine protease
MSVTIDALEARRLFAFSDYAKLIGQDVAVEQFPNLTGAGQTVAVIDTGIDYTHPNLGGGFGAGFKVKAGFDFVDNDLDPRDRTADGHGTAVAGMIAASKFTRNGIDYQGIAPDAELIALRAGTSVGFSDDNIQRALQWVINNRERYGITIVNLSLGGESFTREQVEDNYADEFKRLRDAGVALIAAAGNDGRTLGDTVGYPAADPDVFAIGSISAQDQLSEFSNRGALVDLLAPGDQVITTKVNGGTTAPASARPSSPASSPCSAKRPTTRCRPTT